MCEEERGEKLLNIIESGIIKHAEQTTNIILGDRSSYVGMSDLGGFITCNRAAILKKISSKTDHNFAQLITLNRGHWFEDGIAKSIESMQLPNIRQLELAINIDDTPIKVHYDFVLASTTPKPTIRILEVKSCLKIPEELYSSYEMQTYGQVGMMYRYWNDRCFTYKDETGKTIYANKTFPEIAKLFWDMRLPKDANKVDIEAWVLGVSMNDAKVYGPYVYNSEFYDYTLKTAKEMWLLSQQVKEGFINKNDLKTATGFNPICDKCEYNEECPKFMGTDHPELQASIDELKTWKDYRAKLDEMIKEKEQSMKDWYSHLKEEQGWINCGNYRFIATPIAGRKTLDRDALKSELQDIFTNENMDDVDVGALIARHEKQSAPSMRLTINTIN